MPKRIADEIREKLNAPLHIYSDGELRELGIDPKLFVFISRPDFSDNTYALWEYIDQNTDYKTAWLLLFGEHSAKLTEKGIANAVYSTPEGRALARSARFYVCNTDIAYVKKYPGQVFINLWHGSGVKALDYIVFDGDHPRLESVKQVVGEFDLSLVHSRVDKINMAAEYSCDARQFVASGQPRLDRLKKAAGKENILKLFRGALAGYDNLVLYTPTHRIVAAHKEGDFFSSNIFNIDDYDERGLHGFLCRSNTALVIKLHPLDGNKFKSSDFRLGANCYLLNDDDLFYADLQMNDILGAFDVMIADYSSIVTDFMMLDRPIVYLIGDFDAYSKNKGFVYNDVSFYMPGDKATDFSSLMAALKDALTHPQRHSEWRRTVYQQKSTFMDDNACARALGIIENYKPLTNYEEVLFTKKTLLPMAEQYERELDIQKEQICDYERRIASAIELMEKALPEGSAMEAALAALTTPTLSDAEQKARAAKSALEAMCDEILSGYPGEVVFFSLPQQRNWTGKARTMVQHFAHQTAKKGYLFLLGETEDVPYHGLLARSAAPACRTISDRLVILNYCDDTKTVLTCIRRHGKKIVFVIPSDFYTTDGNAVETGASLAHETLYFYRYQIKHYLGKKDHQEIDIFRWNALEYACRREDVHLIACTEHLHHSVLESAGPKKVLLQTPGVDYAMFAEQRDTGAVPKQLRAIKNTGRPIIGYCGTIDERIYFSVIHYVCGARKDYQFVFIGENRIEGTWGHLFEDYPNIHLIGEAEYDAMPAIMNMLDVAIVPYFKNAKEHIPAKIFEYFACGKPVVTTDMTIGKRCGNIFIGATHGDFAACLDEAYAAKDDANIRANAAFIARENDWSLKVAEILRRIGM